MANSGSFTEYGQPVKLNLHNARYFSTMIFTTVCYGDISPLGINKLIASMQEIMGIALNIEFIGYILASRRFDDGKRIKENREKAYQAGGTSLILFGLGFLIGERGRNIFGWLQH